MIKSGFRFGNKGTWDFDMKVEKLPALRGGARKRTSTDVAGRNGTLHVTQNAFSNYIQPYDCYFHSAVPAPEQAHAIRSWLMCTGAYCRLEDTYDPKYYRLATFAGPLDIENVWNKYGRCTVNFDCDPRYFLKSGEAALTFTEAGQLMNPTAFTALPLITVYGTDAGTVTVGTATVDIRTITDPIILDCELQHAYSQPGEGAPESKNGSIKAIPFPTLAPGSNPIAFSGGITKIEIIPRWWEL